MGKAKLTLSVDEDILREAKATLARHGVSISNLVEDMLSSASVRVFFESVAEELGLGDVEPIRPEEVESSRRRGLKAELAVREVRSEREEKILPGHKRTS